VFTSGPGAKCCDTAANPSQIIINKCCAIQRYRICKLSLSKSIGGHGLVELHHSYTVMEEARCHGRVSLQEVRKTHSREEQESFYINATSCFCNSSSSSPLQKR
jgi:phage gp36-like protein